MEEVETDEDGEAGVDAGRGLSRRQSRRQLGMDTGEDGDNHATSRAGFAYYSEDEEGGLGRYDEEYRDDDDDDDSSGDDGELAGVDLEALSPEERDEILLQSAYRQIQRAQERGSSDVHLTKDELAAMERRKKRMEEEEAARRAARRRSRSQRIAIPLSQLEPTSSRRQRAPSAADLTALDPHGRGGGYPPMGYFPPPSAPRTRSSTNASQRPPSRATDGRGSSPFAYTYAQQQSASSSRYASDTNTPRSRASRTRHGEEGEASSGSSNSPRRSVDPFQYQVSGPRAPRVSGAAAASGTRRHVSGPAELAHGGSRRVVAPPAAARRPATPAADTSEDSSDDSSSDDDDDDDAPAIATPPPARRTRGGVIVVEEDKSKKPPSPQKKPSSGSNASGGGARQRRRRK